MGDDVTDTTGSTIIRQRASSLIWLLLKVILIALFINVNMTFFVYQNF